jgi:hypothetical protein
VTTQPTPNLGAQPTGRTPTGPAQPIAHLGDPTHHRRSAHWASATAGVLWAVGGLAYTVGCTAQGYAGAVLGGAALGVSAAHWAAHLHAGRGASRAAHWAPIAWAPMSAAQARATLPSIDRLHIVGRPTRAVWVLHTVSGAR